MTALINPVRDTSRLQRPVIGWLPSMLFLDDIPAVLDRHC